MTFMTWMARMWESVGSTRHPALHLKYCVVIGMEAGPRKADAEQTYYILLLREQISSRNEYKRVGVGKIKARYVSQGYREGKLL